MCQRKSTTVEADQLYINRYVIESKWSKQIMEGEAPQLNIFCHQMKHAVLRMDYI